MLDLYQVRRDLVAMRSRHSENVALTKRINKLLEKIAYVREPESSKQAAELKQMVAKVTGKNRAPDGLGLGTLT